MRNVMNRTHTSMVVMGLLLALAPSALASTTWYVNGVSGSDSNNCLSATTACQTIGHAISLSASGDSIVVAPATYHENITIAISLSIIGSGARTTIIDGSGKSTVVSISNAAANVSLSQLTIQNGSPHGIYNIGTLELTSSTVRNNYIYESCVNYCSGIGAGIRNSGTLTITSSTIASNSIDVSCSPRTYPYLCSAYGGGISNEGAGRVTIVNSTLSGNSVSGKMNGQPFGCCGAIFMSLDNQTSLTISSSTIAGNSASGSIGGIVGVTTIITDSILANNVGGNCSTSMVSKGYNLSSDASCNFAGPGDLNNHDPLLSPLQNNGGPTDTMALLPGSPAIDGGNPAGCTDGLGNLLKTDQRGMPRPDKEDSVGCDIGAYENQSD
jgi:hypothetical protein